MNMAQSTYCFLMMICTLLFESNRGAAHRLNGNASRWKNPNNRVWYLLRNETSESACPTN